MKKSIIVLSCVLIALAVYTNVFAYSIDGALGDWGVTPFTSWAPTVPTADFIVWDNVRPGGGTLNGWGGERYDVEALYFDDDPEYLYFAMVTSFPMRGRDDVRAGDLALDFDGDLSDYGFGIKIRNMPLGYNPDQPVIEDPRWALCCEADANPVFMRRGTGSLIGYADIAYVRIGNDRGVRNWVVEGRVSKSIFPDFPDEGDKAYLHWAMYCGNDYIDLCGDFDGTVVPEPATVSLLGIGVLGLLRRLRRKG